MTSDPASDGQDLMARLQGTSLGATLADPDERRRQVYSAWASHSDPLIREIGAQLRDGVMTVGDLDRVEEYREVLRRGLQAISTVDVNALVDVAVDLDKPGQPNDERRREDTQR